MVHHMDHTALFFRRFRRVGSHPKPQCWSHQNQCPFLAWDETWGLPMLLDLWTTWRHAGQAVGLDSWAHLAEAIGGHFCRKKWDEHWWVLPYLQVISCYRVIWLWSDSSTKLIISCPVVSYLVLPYFFMPIFSFSQPCFVLPATKQMWLPFFPRGLWFLEAKKCHVPYPCAELHVRF